MERRFTRLRRGPLAAHGGASEVPDNGMCLSVFLVLEALQRDGAVLMGKVDPKAPWWEIGAVDPDRLTRIGDAWMLPSRQLAFFESPDEAARRILSDQLGVGPLPLRGPFVFSDVTERPDTGRDPHWDMHFVYRGRWDSPTLPRSSAWRQLQFVEVARTDRREIARGQGDVLELVGLAPRG